MSATEADQPEGTGYIRGGGGAHVDPVRLTRIVVLALAAILVAAAIVTAVSQAESIARDTNLRTKGVPVLVTVDSCVGIGAGVGQAVNYFTCRGSFTQGGQTYTETIGGNRGSLVPGSHLEAFAVPGDPKSLSTTNIRVKDSSWSSYLAAILLAASAAVLLLGLLVWSRR